MRIVCIDDFAELGGAQLVLLEQMRGLRARGHEIAFVVPDGGRLAKALRREGLPLEPLDLADLKRTWWRVGPAIAARRRLRRLLADASIVHCNSLWALTVLGGAAPRDTAVVCAVHAFPIVRSPVKRHLGRALLARARRRVDRFLVVSEALRQALIRQGYPAERLLLLPNGVDLRRFDPSRFPRRRDDPSSTGRELRVGMLGRLHPGKGQGVLVEACRVLAERRVAFSCRIIGAEFTTPLENLGFTRTLEARIEALGLADRVALCGFVSDVPATLAELDVIALPSSEETFGMALLEGMAMGLAPVASRVGGIPELVRHEQNGLLVPPGNVGALADALQRLAENPELLAALQRAARKTAEEHSLEHTVTQLEALYRLLGERPRHTRRSA